MDERSRTIHQEVRPERSRVIAMGTVSCPACDAPVSPDGAMALHAPITCPFCGQSGSVRDFLSLSTPGRPARVEIRIR